MPTLNISYSSLVRVVIVLLVLAFLFLVRDVILILFLSIILSSAFKPWVDWFERRHIPRGGGVLTIYVLFFVLLSVFSTALAPAVTRQTQGLVKNLPAYYEVALDKLNLSLEARSFITSQNIETFNKAVGSLLGKAIPAVRGIFSGGATIFLILFLTFYLSVDDRAFKRFVRSILPSEYQPYFQRIINRIQDKMGRWLRGQLFLCLVIFVVMAISLFILHQITGHVPYWLILAFMAGFLEIVPFVGPFVSGAIAVLLILNVSFWIALIVAVIYLVVQQLESNILVPKVMQKSVGLNPLVAILAVVVGSRLAGIMGAVIAIPIAASLQVFLQDVMPAKKEVEEEEVRN